MTHGQYFSLEKWLIPEISSHLFCNLKDPVLVQTLSYERNITYHLLLISFSHKLISVQDFGHNMLHLNAAHAPSMFVKENLVRKRLSSLFQLNESICSF